MYFSILSLDTIWEQIVAAAFYSCVILAIGWLWGRWRTIKAWQNKQFKNRIVLSLNSLVKQNDKWKLSLRTIFERDIQAVFQNDTMVKIVTDAVSETKEDRPILMLDSKDSWFILNAILNQIAEHFASGIVRKDLGLPVTSKWYTFCLTYEKEGGMRAHKVRALLIQKDLLLNFPDGELLLESEHHTTRVKTLRYLKQEYSKNPHLFMDVEISQ